VEAHREITLALIELLLRSHPDWHGIMYQGRYVGQWNDGGTMWFARKPQIGDVESIPENEYANAFVWKWEFRGNMDGDVFLFEYASFQENRKTD